jgi:hypothetical protein
MGAGGRGLVMVGPASGTGAVRFGGGAPSFSGWGGGSRGLAPAPRRREPRGRDVGSGDHLGPEGAEASAVGAREALPLARQEHAGGGAAARLQQLALALLEEQLQLPHAALAGVALTLEVGDARIDRRNRGGRRLARLPGRARRRRARRAGAPRAPLEERQVLRRHRSLVGRLRRCLGRRRGRLRIPAALPVLPTLAATAGPHRLAPA